MKDARVQTRLKLSAVHGGESARVRQLEGGQALLSRLVPLGFTLGARLRVVQNPGRGPLLVTIRDTRIALGRGEADKIVVEPLVGGDDDN
jgi:ferrous iron transport protein A